MPIAPSPHPIVTRFEDPFQEQYFRLFCNETSLACSGGWEDPLWQIHILQACHSEPCILQCAVAIAALDQACRTSSIGLDTAESHHRYALQHYGKALKSLQEVTTRGKSTRTVLLASLLIYCFENFHGDSRLALTHVQSALELMSNWLAATPRVSSSVGLSPSPHEIEDDLVSTLARLDITVSTFLSGVDPLVGRLAKYTISNNSTLTIPPVFMDVAEADRVWVHIMNRVFIFIAMAPRVMGLPKVARDKVMDGDGIQYTNTPVLEEIYAWQASFESILLHSRTPAGDKSFVRATMLRVLSVILSCAVRYAFFDRSKHHLTSVFLPEFCEIVALASSVIDHPSFIRGFVFETAFIPSLFVVVVLCRDKMVRTEIIRIAKAMYPRREGVWDSAMLIKMGEELLMAEESARDNLYRDEWVGTELDSHSWTDASAPGDSTRSWLYPYPFSSGTKNTSDVNLSSVFCLRPIP